MREGGAFAKRQGKAGGTGITRRVALAGNPNVGKSTLFNTLTGLSRHTGNWSGKTVDLGYGVFESEGVRYELCDLPGAYSLFSHSPEEAVAEEHLAFGSFDVAVVVVDAGCLARGLKLVLEVMSLCPRVAVAVNLIDEARRSGVSVDTEKLSELLGVPVIATVAKKRATLDSFAPMIEQAMRGECPLPPLSLGEEYDAIIDRGEKLLKEITGESARRLRYLSLRLLVNPSYALKAAMGFDLDATRVKKMREFFGSLSLSLGDLGMDGDGLSERLASLEARAADGIAERVVTVRDGGGRRGELFDRILTGRYTAIPVMLAMLFGLLYLTVSFANYPSELLGACFDFLGRLLRSGLLALGCGDTLVSFLLDGVYGTLAEVVSVMLPPMAIFFPLFSLLEDSGVLPRIAYNLDSPFRCAGACGKQGLTMCMGLGCNAAGVVGCRIIDSERERKIAMITNALVPCNGRFPTLILLLSTFIVGEGIMKGTLVALLLLALVVLGFLMTLLVSFILSRTVFRGSPSFFTIELPPPRRPDVRRTLTRSFLDRTVSVLLRAIAVSIPAGAVIWLISYIRVGGVSLFSHISDLLDPVGRFLGMDGVMLSAFILGLPANEIVLPVALVGYSSMNVGEMFAGNIGESLRLVGWTPAFALSVILFSLFHFPCSTTVITVWRESKSVGVTLLSVFLPTLVGVVLCALLNFLLTAF